MSAELIERIEALESRLEFQDETIATLSDQLAHSQRQLFELSRKFDLLVKRLRENEEDAEHPASDPRLEPPPPHY